MSKDKIEVLKVVLKLDGKNVELTIKQAMELKELLNNTFPDKEIKYIPSYPYYPPIYINYPKKRWNDWQITWTGNATTVNAKTNETFTSGTVYISNNTDYMPDSIPDGLEG